MVLSTRTTTTMSEYDIVNTHNSLPIIPEPLMQDVNTLIEMLPSMINYYRNNENYEMALYYANMYYVALKSKYGKILSVDFAGVTHVLGDIYSDLNNYTYSIKFYRACIIMKRRLVLEKKISIQLFNNTLYNYGLQLTSNKEFSNALPILREYIKTENYEPTIIITSKNKKDVIEYLHILGAIAICLKKLDDIDSSHKIIELIIQHLLNIDDNDVTDLFINLFKICEYNIDDEYKK